MANERKTALPGVGLAAIHARPRDVPADSTEIPILAQVDARGEYMPPIYDQGHLGSCTANAVAAAIDADRLVDGQGAMSPSRLAIYWLERYLSTNRPPPTPAPWAEADSRPPRNSAGS